jgi:SnoaL-like domain
MKERRMLDQRQISDHIEITQLLYRYGRAIDTRDFALLATVFTPDAAIHYNVFRGVSLPFPQMVDWLRQALQIFRVTQHAMSNPMIDLADDSARATTYVSAAHLQVKLDGGHAYALQHGLYVDALVRTERGWRIRERRLENLFVHGAFLGPDEVQKFATPVPL